MEIFDGHRALLRPLATPSVAIGNFDGVHLGHQALLDEAAAAAHQRSADAVCFTFDPHPAVVLAPQHAPPLITSRSRKLELIAERGIDVCVIEPFTRELAALPPDQFLQEIVVDILGARHVVVGYDFTYGHKRGGNTDTLRAFGARHGIEVQVVEPISVDGIVASSSKVRSCVAAGDLTGARLVLGRYFDVDGVVVAGDGRGRTIGVPTANLRPEGQLLPPSGVYAVTVQFLDAGIGASAGGVANLGTRPTFYEGAAQSLEIHLLDFDGDLYDRRLRVGFVEHLRSERRFAGVEELVTQIRADIEHARTILARGGDQ